MTQWNPSHKASCRIWGWLPGCFSVANQINYKFSRLFQTKTTPKRLITEVWGGGTDLQVLSLDQLYAQHILGWNTWSRSNMGFDLARYHGTTFYLSPHKSVPYIFMWERNWDQPLADDFHKMHPATLLLGKRRVLIKPRAWGNRKTKKVFVAPPTLQSSVWYFMKSWCGVGLLRFGVTPINLEHPFVKGGQQRYGVSIGWAQESQVTPPLPIYWAVDSLGGGFTHEVMYRWWWDDGVDNYIMTNEKNLPPSNSAQGMPSKAGFNVVKINMPYYKYFYGMQTFTAKFTVGSDVNGSNPALPPGLNPSPYAIFWYRDVGLREQSTNYLYLNPNVHKPSDLPSTQKVWVILSRIKPSIWAKTAWVSSQGVAEGSPSWSVTGKILNQIVGSGPFAMYETDVNPQDNFNVTIRYCSHWQWGGIAPRPDNVVNPCTEGSDQPRGLQVQDPATVGASMLHPWDLDKHGFITKEKLQDILTQLSHPTITGQPVPEITGHPVPEGVPKKFSEESDRPWLEEDEQSGSDSTPTASDSDEEEEDPRATRQILRRLLRHQRHGDVRWRKLKHVLHTLST